MEFAPLCPCCGRPVPQECEWHAYHMCENCWVDQSPLPASTSMSWSRRDGWGERYFLPVRLAAKEGRQTKPGPCKPRRKLTLSAFSDRAREMLR